MKRDEALVHVAIRNYLRRNGWTLIAGQYPGGSDDELHILNIFDPLLAKDQSPDSRRHSFGKLVPDLIAFKDGHLLIIEAKPEYSTSDKEKLNYLLSDRRKDFLASLYKFAIDRNQNEIFPVEKLDLIPVLAFLKENSALTDVDDIACIKVIDLDNVETKAIP